MTITSAGAGKDSNTSKSSNSPHQKHQLRVAPLRALSPSELRSLNHLMRRSHQPGTSEPHLWRAVPLVSFHDQHSIPIVD